MIVDASALVAILKGEPEAERFTERVVSESAKISAANWLEAAMVADGSGDPAAGDNLDRIVATAEIDVVPVTAEQASFARLAFRRFGRGSGAGARLNFGDCFAYALSVTSGEPLLFKGDDFRQTDVLPAEPGA
ncbi:type II toxin-antitoxin system VapC family toxin [Georgenia deserti]|uniref:Ribonuclease VapC n=1 Tax=Georgenia deserti TaxID=2093781 RepID=A0ABW4L4L9_9MICO